MMDKLLAMRLNGIAQGLQAQEQDPAARELSFLERLGLLIDQQWSWRENQSLARRLKKAKLRGNACVEEIDYRAARGLDKGVVRALAQESAWVAKHENLFVLGPTGVGKSFVASALAQKACRDGYTVHYARVPRLFADLDLAHGDGRFARLFRMLVKVDLLVLDDWGPDRLSPSQRRDLMEIVEDRHGRGSMLITSQLPVASWHDVIGEPTLGDAILDRIVHNAYRLELDGPSMRKIKASEAADPTPVAPPAADPKAPRGAKR
jgi:DNA replication protein DnaC